MNPVRIFAIAIDSVGARLIPKKVDSNGMKSTNQSGSTLIELIVVITVFGLVLALVMTFYADRVVDSWRSYNRVIVQQDTKQALESIERIAKSAKSVQDINLQLDTHRPPPPGWNSGAAVLVLATMATNSSGTIIYVDPLTHNTPYTNDTIFYLDANTSSLYKRTIANPAASGNTAVTTCSDTSVNVTPCSGEPADTKLIDNVAAFGLTYFDSNGVNIPAAPFNGASSVKVTVGQSRTMGGKIVTTTLTSLVKLRNN